MKSLLPFLKLFKKQWFMMLLGLILSFITLAAGIGLLSLSGWFLSASAVAGLSVATAQAFNFFTPAGGVRFLSIARTASRYGERLATHEATFRLLTDLRRWSWRRILPLSAGNLQQMRQADILNRLVADIDTLDHLYLRLITPMLVSGVMLVGLYLFIAWFDPVLAISLCGLLLLAWLGLPVIFYRLGLQPGRQQVEAKRHYRVMLLETIQGLAELSLFNAVPLYREKLRQSELSMLQSQRAMAKIAGLSQAALLLINGFAVALILYLASAGVGEHTQPGPLLALVVFATMASIEMMMPVAGAFSHLSSCIQAAERVNEIVEQRPHICFPDSEQNLAQDASIELANVAFSYVPHRPVLKHFDLRIGSGQHVALLGETGCGKSSVLSLMSRQWQAQQGQLSIGGHNVADYTEPQLRQMMTVVSQRVYIFSGSLRNNLKMALPPGKAVDDLQLMLVLQQVGLDNLLDAEKPLDQLVGEGGRSLSGGEQRRIGVARALLRDAPILLLDEPTEGLDKQTEREVMSLLLNFAQGKTLLMISHRLLAMANMDVIHLMADGKIRVSGTHEQLLESDTVYAKLQRRPQI